MIEALSLVRADIEDLILLTKINSSFGLTTNRCAECCAEWSACVDSFAR